MQEDERDGALAVHHLGLLVGVLILAVLVFFIVMIVIVLEPRAIPA
jgi:hypothetical protein